MKADTPASGLIQVIFLLFAGVAGGLVVLLLAVISNSQTFQKFVIGFIPTALAFKLFLSCAVITLDDRRNLFRPITAFIFACGLYHGVGVMICSFGNSDQIASIQIYQNFGMLELIRVLVLNQFSIFVVLGSYLGVSVICGPPIKLPLQALKPRPELFSFLIILGLWGLVVKFFIMLPWDMKLVSQAPAGLIVATHSLSYGTLFFLWYRSALAKQIALLTIVFTGLDVLYGLIALQKMPVILPIITSLLGYLAARPIKIRTCFLLGVAGFIFLSILQPVNTFLDTAAKAQRPSQ